MTVGPVFCRVYFKSVGNLYLLEGITLNDLPIPFGLPGLAVNRATVRDDVVTVEASTTSPSASCPKCGEPSERVHSRYVRSPRDLPLGSYPVRLALRVRRFRCQNPGCPKRTFVERLPNAVPVCGQRTFRLTDSLRVLGFALGGEAGARIGQELRMPTSPDTLLRVIRTTELPACPIPNVVGVDDFALKKGHSYGTILVDLERHRPVDLLPDRSADGLADWLRQHPTVEVLARDRSAEYARGATEGAPQARQVADRWHLLVNLREALERFLARIQGRLRELPLGEKDAQRAMSHRRRAPRTLRLPSLPEQEGRETRRDRRLDCWESARKMQAQGIPIRHIAQSLGISWTTARNFAHAETFPERSPRRRQASLIDAYVEHLLERWEEGCHNASQLWRELRERGYPGGRIQVARWVSHQRELPAATTPRKYIRPPSTDHGHDANARDRATLEGAQGLAWLLLRADDRLDEVDAATLKRIRQDPEVVVAHDLARCFQAMVRQRLPCQLEEWLQACAAKSTVELRNLALYLERDMAAVRAALVEEWSNGQTEGQITRLKLIKRQMYGRAKFDLLRQRVLAA